jgi:hypothetical protein
LSDDLCTSSKTVQDSRTLFCSMRAPSMKSFLAVLRNRDINLSLPKLLLEVYSLSRYRNHSHFIHYLRYEATHFLHSVCYKLKTAQSPLSLQEKDKGKNSRRLPDSSPIPLTHFLFNTYLIYCSSISPPATPFEVFTLYKGAAGRI